MTHDENSVRKILDQAKAAKREALTAPEARGVCEAYGITIPKEGVAKSAEEAAKLASDIGFPVVMKIVSPQILHKTEAGGVIVGVKSAEAAKDAYAAIVGNAKKYDAKAEILGVQVQQMLAGGQEVIIGAVTDPAFGKLVAFGLGGILVEVLKDITFRLAPATNEEALSMLDGIAAAEILRGVRGAKPVHRAALAGMIEKVSALVADFPEISEMDLNPVFATEQGATAADVRIVLDFNPAPARDRPSQAAIVEKMTRIMKPKAVAVIGASAENGKIGNSVMKNLINGGYQGEIYPIHPNADQHHGQEGLQERQGRAGRYRCRGVRHSGEIRRAGADRGRREENRRRHFDPFGIRRDRQCGRAERVDRDRPQVRRAAHGAEYLRLLLHAQQSVRDLLHGIRRQGPRGAVLAVGRHRHGHHRLLALGQDGRIGHRRAGQQVRHRRRRLAHLLRAGREHDHHCPAPARI